MARFPSNSWIEHFVCNVCRVHSGCCHKYYLTNKDVYDGQFHIYKLSYESQTNSAITLSYSALAQWHGCVLMWQAWSVSTRCQHELSNRGGCRSVPRVCCNCMTLGAPCMCVYIDWCSGCSFQRPNWVMPVVLLLACLTNLSFLSSNSPIKLMWHSLSY